MAEQSSTVGGTLTTVFENVPQVSFSWYDYLLFSLMLAISALIGIYFGCFGSKQSSADEYLMGNKKMKVIPIAISLVASHISGITLLAVPADVYRYGAGYWLYVFSLLLVTICTIFVYLPVFFKLQITSTYEYLERRFDNTNRLFASFLFTLGLFLYLPIVIYIPALAFSAATGVNIHYVTPLVCGVCIFYTTLGGLKAVVWTDTLQFMVTTGAVITVTVIGIKSGGGVGEIWAKALEGHRLDIFDFNPDPTLRDSFWIVTIGVSIHWLAIVGIHQSCVQKYLSVASYREAKLSLTYFAIGISLISSVSIFIGLIMYARYASCDPFTLGVVQKNDQLLPYYIMDVASHIPGLSGLFIAGIFCAALSTLSASLNCLAGTVFEDFVLKITGPINNEKKAAFILKLIVVVTGVICTALVFVVERLGGLLALSFSLVGVTAGPLLGMFTLGILCPKASSKGTFYGAIAGLLVTGWIAVMAQYYKGEGLIADVPKPTSIEGCMANTTVLPTLPLSNTTYTFETFQTDNIASDNATSVNSTPDEEKPFFLYRVSHYYYSPLGTAVTMIVALLISYLTKSDDPPVHRDLLSPVIYFMLSDVKVQEKDYYSVNKALEMVNTHSCQDEKLKT